MATRRQLRLPLRRALVALAIAGCALTLLPASSQAAPTRSIAQVSRDLDRLQNQAEIAAERYNAAEMNLATAQSAYTKLQAKVAAAQATLDSLKGDIATIVATLYRSDAGGSSLSLLSAASPATYLAQAAAVESLTRQREDVLRRVQTAEQELASDQLAAGQKLALVRTARADAAAAKAQINAKVAAEKRLLASMRADQRAKLLAERAAAARAAAARARAYVHAQPSRVRTRSVQLPKVVGHASGRAAGAVAFALRQVGKRYVYGAAGPSAFDCSGLTMAAYRSVGVYLPHQSGQQFHYGRHVSANDLQPGDLVFYYSPIHHVGIYIGNGRIVHAANPGEGVTVAGVFSMPFSGAVRLV
ncbi:MAG TPA: NlpC/P60 family protein [Actinomycetes bacterium]|nr:NlpC/P60 family protein [Actinomycetes bacterium]